MPETVRYGDMVDGDGVVAIDLAGFGSALRVRNTCGHWTRLDFPWFPTPCSPQDITRQIAAERDRLCSDCCRRIISKQDQRKESVHASSTP